MSVSLVNHTIGTAKTRFEGTDEANGDSRSTQSFDPFHHRTRLIPTSKVGSNEVYDLLRGGGAAALHTVGIVLPITT